MSNRGHLARQALIEELGQDIADGRVLRAIGEVRRECFVPPKLRKHAWENRPLPIGEGQTISQPFVVARMCELLELKGDETVLDVGTGSGYHAAVLARLAARVVSIERRARLSEGAARNLFAAGVENVELVVGDGSRGHLPTAPYDAISVAAACSSGVPQELEDQLASGGRLVIPADAGDQRLVLVRSLNGKKTRESLERVRFVPLITEGRDRAAENGPIQSIAELASSRRPANLEDPVPGKSSPNPMGGNHATERHQEGQQARSPVRAHQGLGGGTRRLGGPG